MVITQETLKTHNTRDREVWIALHNKVYNVSKFLEEHPGGEEVILQEAGKDATEAFEDVGHSDEARELLPDMFVGDLEESGSKPVKPKPAPSPAVHKAVESGSNMMYILPLGLLAVYFAWRLSGAA